MKEFEIEGVGVVRPLNDHQIHRLKRVRGPNKAIAPYAMSVGLTYQQFRKLSPAKQREIIDAHRRMDI